MSTRLPRSPAPRTPPVVVEDSKMGWMENAALYLAPAHIDHRISGNYLYARHHDGADNCHVLLISGFRQSDEGFVDISPQPAWPKVIDAKADTPQPCGSGDLHPINPATRDLNIVLYRKVVDEDRIRRRPPAAGLQPLGEFWAGLITCASGAAGVHEIFGLIHSRKGSDC